VFDRLFGEKHISWRCFRRSVVSTLITSTVAVLLTVVTSTHEQTALRVRVNPIYLFIFAVIGNAVPDYMSLLKSRGLIAGVARWSPHVVLTVIAMVGDVALSVTFGLVAALMAGVLGIISITVISPGIPEWSEFPRYPDLIFDDAMRHSAGLYLLPASVISGWFCIYASSGVLLKAARQLDAGFERIKRWFDIENKPLQAIGLVSGAICAFVYWAFAIVRAIVA
jgi:hypothetical protein